MALKLARDHFRPYRNRGRLLAFAENATVIAFLTASLVILGIVAVVRFHKPLGQGGADSVETQAAIQWFSALLGLLLPFLSAVYFIKGYDQIASRLRLTLAWLISLLSQARSERLTHLVAASKAMVERNNLELALLEQATALDNVIGQVRAAYRLGYAEGFLKLVYTSPSVLEVTRTRLISQQVAETL